MPPVMSSIGDAGKARRAQHVGEWLRLGKAADRFHQIAIGFGVAGDDAAELRNDIERIGVVERIEAGNIHGGEFKAEKPSADLEHAERFGQRPIDARHVADAEGDGRGVEAAVLERQRLGIGFGERHGVGVGTRGGALAPDGEHVRIDVADGGAGILAAGFDHPQRHVTGAAGDVKERKWPAFGRIHRRHQRILPGPVQPERHQVVHQVVAVRHAVKYVVDQRLLVGKRHLAQAEMGGFCHRFFFLSAKP